MGTYDRQIALAVRMISEKGAACVWLKPGAYSGLPEKPGPAAPDIQTSCRVLLLPNKRDGLAGFFSMFTNTEVPTGGMRGLMANVPFTPELTDHLQIPSGEILGLDDKNGIDALAPDGGPVILYYLRLTR